MVSMSLSNNIRIFLTIMTSGIIFCILFGFNRMNILMKNIVKNIYDNSNDNKAFEPIVVCIDIIYISFSSYKVRLVLQTFSGLLKTFLQEDSNCALVNDFSFFAYGFFARRRWSASCSPTNHTAITRDIVQKRYFVTKIVLTYCEKKLF